MFAHIADVLYFRKQDVENSLLPTDANQMDSEFLGTRKIYFEQVLQLVALCFLP